MRPTALILALCATLAFAADEVAPAPAADNKAQLKELEMKLKTIREQALKGDVDLDKLKAEADDAKKRYDTAVETKLKANADYQKTKEQYDALRGKKSK